jgi:hypothetical protein
VIFLLASYVDEVGIPSQLAGVFMSEQELHSGMLQVLKWTMEFCSPDANGQLPTHETIHAVVMDGSHYEAFVDALKMANHDRVEIVLDAATRMLTVFEGANRTGFDDQLVSFQQQTLPLRAQTPLIDDGDRLTSRWSAGDFRKAIRTLVEIATRAEEPILLSTETGNIPLFQRPTVFEVPPQFYEANKVVLDDIILDPTKVMGEAKWKLIAWLDIPLTLIGTGIFAVSNQIKALRASSPGGP